MENVGVSPAAAGALKFVSRFVVAGDEDHGARDALQDIEAFFQSATDAREIAGADKHIDIGGAGGEFVSSGDIAMEIAEEEEFHGMGVRWCRMGRGGEEGLEGCGTVVWCNA